MNNFAAALVVTGLMLSVGTIATPSSLQSRTVWEGTYTSGQADRGVSTYKQACAPCHGENLTGSGIAPGLTGEDFTFQWTNRSVGDLYERIRTLMPPDNPG